MIEVARIRVLYADTDQMGVVNHAQYFRFFEIGRCEWLRARGWAYRELEDQGMQLPVIEGSARYLRPARYDDLLRVRAAPRDVRRASLTFDYEIADEAGQLLTVGFTRHACLGRNGRPQRFPSAVLALLESATKP
jgi:acyl-CoA thioester hydrolase